MSEGKVQEHGEDWEYGRELAFNYEQAIGAAHKNDSDIAGYLCYGNSSDVDVEAIVSGVVSGEVRAGTLADIAFEQEPTPEEIYTKKAKASASGRKSQLKQKFNVDALRVAVRDGDELLVDALKERVSLSALVCMVSEALDVGLTDFADDILNDIKNTENNRYRKVAVRDVILLAAKQGDMDSFWYFMRKAEEAASFLYDTDDDKRIKALFLDSGRGSGSPVSVALGARKNIALDVVKILHHEYGFSIKSYIKSRSPAMKVVCP